MKILISGATGLLGNAIREHLLIAGHEVHRLVRNRQKIFVGDIYWNPANREINTTALEGYDAVIHLAGENISRGPWTPKIKQNIRDSRIHGTELLSKSLASLHHKPKVLISASATGFYGNGEHRSLDETSPNGKGFLAEVCKAWEKAAEPARGAGIRVIHPRFGIVLSSEGGILQKLALPFSFGLGGRIGNGQQWMSWISIVDVCRVIAWMLEEPSVHGPVNVVSPEPVTNGDFTKAFARSLRRPALVPLPVFAARGLLGEMADELLLSSSRVQPAALKNAGFEFHHKSLPETLSDIASDGKLFDQHFRAEVWVPHTRKKVFPFFSDPTNLEKLTPPLLHFHIVRKTTETTEEASEFTYKLKIHGVPVRWKSRIEQWKPQEVFCDRQLIGPYAKWFHTHRFFDFAGGTLMTDHVAYRVPLGTIGRWTVGPFIRSDIQRIFSYREKIVREIFP